MNKEYYVGRNGMRHLRDADGRIVCPFWGFSDTGDGSAARVTSYVVAEGYARPFVVTSRSVTQVHCETCGTQHAVYTYNGYIFPEPGEALVIGGHVVPVQTVPVFIRDVRGTSDGQPGWAVHR